MDDNIDTDELGALLRSESRKDQARAKRYIKQRTKGLWTESDRAEALGLPRTTWLSWRTAGLVESLPEDKSHRGRPPKPQLRPAELKSPDGRHRITVSWVYVRHGTDVQSTQRRRAEVSTSTGKTFSISSWEGEKFLDAIRSFGWVDVQSA